MARTAISAMQELQQYRQIGTVEQCREARQKKEPMQADENDYCPICHSYGRDEEGIAGYFCPNCGQALKFTGSEEEEYVKTGAII